MAGSGGDTTTAAGGDTTTAGAPSIAELFSLRGRVALVTGGSKGLGLSIAQGFAQAGATIVLASRDESVCAARAEEIAGAEGVECVGWRLDVTDEGDVAAVFARAVERFGALDVVVNCAGINLRSPVEECSLADFDRVLDVNVRGSWLCCREAGRVMRRAGTASGRGGAEPAVKRPGLPAGTAGRGSVINLGSALSSVGLPERTPYCSAKAGVLGLTRAAALEWAGSGLRCNAICPGPFLTEMNVPLLAQPERAKAVVGRTALQRWGELHEIRGAALFLASDASSYVTGSALYVDGGWTTQ
jgi:NAD(P)-dependent dehydrogenase (short-subunit alcohol dehydrogenase family)